MLSISASRFCALGLLAPLAFLGLGVKRSSSEDVIVRVSASQIDYKSTVLIAQLGVPSKVKVKDADTLASIIERQCGRRDDNYLRLLQERASKYQMIAQPFMYSSKISGDHELELPFCLVIPKQVAKLPPTLAWVPKGVNPAPSSKVYVPTYYWEEAWPKHWQEGLPIRPVPGFQKGPYMPNWPPKTYSFGGDDFFEEAKVLAQSRVIHEGWAKFAVAANIDPNEALKTILDAINAGRVTGFGRDTKPATGAPLQKKIGLVSVLSPGEDKCPERVLPIDKYPFDTMDLLRVIGMNYARGRRLHAASEILIGDTGLSELGQAHLDFALSKDDLYTDERRPFADYPHSHHGEYVATAAFGGANFMRFIELFKQSLNMRPINIISRKDGTLDSQGLFNIIDAGESTTSVINLSISYDQEIKELQTVLDRRRNALFVVAAGNTPSVVTNQYPAALGGQYTNLIVVTSLDQYGQFETKQSAWSDAHVELAAPGCRIPVYGYAKREGLVYRSGTSLAAPLVSFTAALLMKYNLGGPAELKTRILASADYDLALKNKVKLNLKLNIIHALALATDVVELNPTAIQKRFRRKPRMIYGKIVKGGNLLLLCDGEKSMGRGTKTNPGPGNRSLLSMQMFHEGDREKIFFMFRVSPTNNIESHVCDLDKNLAEHKVTIEEQDGDTHAVQIKRMRKLLFSVN